MSAWARLDTCARALGLFCGGLSARHGRHARTVFEIADEQAGGHPVAAEDPRGLAWQQPPNRYQRPVHGLAQHQAAWPGGMGRGTCNGGFQLGHALRATPDGSHHGEAKQLLHQGQIAALPGGPRLVGHVEAQNGVGSGLHDLRKQDQVPFELRGVGDDHHHVGRVGQLVLRDPLVGGK